MRHYTSLDHLLINLDQAIRTIWGVPVPTERPDPADAHPETELTAQERARAARLMRVNHAGEVCAQALYQGQALTARLEEVRVDLERAAAEENDHLAWCERRVRELGSHVSVLNPFWYTASFAIGALAGSVGDRWSLGFVAETERQVVEHLERHLRRLPAQDAKSRAILVQMQRDEARHGTLALEAGGVTPPWPVRRLMALTARAMTGTAYYL